MRTASWRAGSPAFIAPLITGQRRPFYRVERTGPTRSRHPLLERSIRRSASHRYRGSAPDTVQPRALVSPSTSRPIERKPARPRRQRPATHVRHAYARGMAPGHWLFTGDAIRFTIKPELIDGQHRMRAPIEAEATLQMVCVFGLEPRAKHALDMGRKRSAGDVLALKGYSQSSRLSGAACQLLHIKHNSQSVRVTNAEIEAIVEKHPKLADVTHHFNSTCGISPALLTALYYILVYLMDDDQTAVALQNAMRRSGGLRPPRLLFKAGVPA